MYSDQELTDLGFIPFHFGEAAEAVIIQADHSEYKCLTMTELPGVAIVLDGRSVLSPIQEIKIISI
jgi:UDP-N-acetyl-D-mannosaminuronate dehydrogenase